jgi:hypothetical protein
MSSGVSHDVRRRSAWLVGLPLLVAGSLISHQLAYAIVGGAQADELLAATGHGYLDRLPLGAALGAVCVVIGLALAGADAVARHRERSIPAWAVGLVPVVGFGVQEHLERLVHLGAFPWHAATEETFVVGMLLQLPFAALAWALASILLRAAAAIAGALRRVRGRWGRPRSTCLPAAWSGRRPQRLGSGAWSRGPPRPSFA